MQPVCPGSTAFKSSCYSSNTQQSIDDKPNESPVLPSEILQRIFENMPLKDMLAMRALSTICRGIIDMPGLWMDLYQRDFRIRSSLNADKAFSSYQTLFNLQHGKVQNKSTLWPAAKVAFSPDNQLIATVGEAGQGFLWKVSNLKEPSQVLRMGDIGSLAFSPDSSCIVGLDDHAVHIQIILAQECPSTPTASRCVESPFVLSPASKFLVTVPDTFLAPDDHSVHVMDIWTGKQLHTLIGHTARVSSSACSPDGNLIATGADDHTVRLWNASTAECIYTLTEHSFRITALVFSPNGKFLASSGGALHLWNPLTGGHVRRLLENLSGITNIVFSPDSKFLALMAPYSRQQAFVWDTSTDAHFRTLKGHTDIINSIAFSPNSSCIATGSTDRTVRVWNSRTGKHLYTIAEYAHEVRSVTFSSDGRFLATTFFSKQEYAEIHDFSPAL